MTLDPAVHWALRGALALLLLHAAAHKLAAPAQFAAALSGYRVVPETLAKLTAAVVVASEVALGLALLVPGSGAAPALGAATLLGVYALAIATNLLRGRRDIDCGCAGPASRRPLSAGLVGRNAVLVAVALIASLPAGPRPLVWVDGVTVAAFLAAASLLYAGAELALAGHPKLLALRGPR